MSNLGAIGIDFGTTKTMLAYSEPGNGRIIVVDSFPTAIRFVDEMTFEWNPDMIGEDAFNAPQGWKNFKKYMADDYVPVEKCREMPLEGDTPPSPVLLASFVFRRLKKKIDEELGIDDNKEIGPVTITVPSERNFLHRQAVVFAANVAGFKDVNILEEPVSAYLYHFLSAKKSARSKKNEKILVVDLGGGTCDLAVIASDNKHTPVVLNSRTIEQGGNDIDDKIVERWRANADFAKSLPLDTTEQYDPQITFELRRAAKLTKHQCNPRPDATPEAKRELIKNPLQSQRSSDNLNTFILLPGLKNGVTPPIITPDDFPGILEDFLHELNKQIDYMLPSRNDIRSIDKVVFAGGSCYVRQVIAFIRKKFNHIEDLDNFLFNEPEHAIAFGALEYQRERNEKRKPIHTRLSMSTYLEVDYHSNEIPDLIKTLNSIKFINHNGKSYIELASKGEPLRLENPDIGAWIGAALTSKVITIPIKKSLVATTWKIYQVRSENTDGKDYEAIGLNTKAIDEITFKPNQLENLLDYWSWLRLIFAFDIYGDFYRNARLGLRPRSHVQTLHGKNPKLDWRNKKRVMQIREDYFKQK